VLVFDIVVVNVLFTLAIAVGICFNVVGLVADVFPVEVFKASTPFAESDITPAMLVSAVVKRDVRFVAVPFKVVMLFALVLLLFVIAMTSAILLKSVLDLSEPRIVDMFMYLFCLSYLTD